MHLRSGKAIGRSEQDISSHPRHIFSDEQRKKLRDHYREYPSLKHAELQSWFEQSFCQNISVSSIARILSNRFDFLDTENELATTERYKDRGRFPDIEERLYEWMKASVIPKVASYSVVREHAVNFWFEKYPQNALPVFSRNWFYDHLRRNERLLVTSQEAESGCKNLADHACKEVSKGYANLASCTAWPATPCIGRVLPGCEKLDFKRLSNFEIPIITNIDCKFNGSATSSRQMTGRPKSCLTDKDDNRDTEKFTSDTPVDLRSKRQDEYNSCPSHLATQSSERSAREPISAGKTLNKVARHAAQTCVVSKGTGFARIKNIRPQMSEITEMELPLCLPGGKFRSQLSFTCTAAKKLSYGDASALLEMLIIFAHQEKEGPELLHILSNWQSGIKEKAQAC